MPEFLINPDRLKLTKDLAKRLPEIRRRSRISQEDLGNMVGKSRQKISDIERGTAPMGWDTYIAICTALEYKKAIDTSSEQWYIEAKKTWFD